MGKERSTEEGHGHCAPDAVRAIHRANVTPPEGSWLGGGMLCRRDRPELNPCLSAVPCWALHPLAHAQGPLGQASGSAPNYCELGSREATGDPPGRPRDVDIEVPSEGSHPPGWQRPERGEPCRPGAWLRRVPSPHPRWQRRAACPAVLHLNVRAKKGQAAGPGFGRLRCLLSIKSKKSGAHEGEAISIRASSICLPSTH